MNLFTLAGGRAQVIPFSPPLEGVVRIRVTAEKPVNVYVLDEDGRRRFAEQVADLRPLAESTGLQTHELVVPGVSGQWFLLLENQRPEDVRGAYVVATPLMGPTGMSGSGGPSAVGGPGRYRF
jgi:hypothetical protein